MMLRFKGEIMDFRQIDRDLQKEYSKKRMFAERVAVENLMRVKKLPAYLKLDAVERELVIEISKCKTKDVSYKNLKQNLETVRVEKEKILDMVGLTQKDLKPKYSCTKCNDTGVSSGKPCECYKKRKNEELKKVFGLETSSQNSFENFDTKICKNAKHAENLQKIAEILKKWAENYPKITKTNIIISGNAGVGKTYLTTCLAGELAKKDVNICFASAFELNEAFMKYHTTFDASKNYWLTPYLEADVLIIDDLGTEPILKNVTKNYFYLILSERERFGKPIVISTNLKLDELNARYDERISSRLCNKRSSLLMFIDGEDLRHTK